jgi:dynactin complex subunit
MNETGLYPLAERVEELEELCDQLLEENDRLRERVRQLEWAMVPAEEYEMEPADDEMEIETERGAQEDAAEKQENGV